MKKGKPNLFTQKEGQSRDDKTERETEKEREKERGDTPTAGSLKCSINLALRGEIRPVLTWRLGQSS